MKELKIYRYTKNTKKWINTEFISQKKLKQPYFVVPFEKGNIRNRAKSLK